MKRFEPLRPRLMAAVLALALGACAGAQKPPDSSGASSATGPAAAGQVQEQFTGRSLRLFDDAVAAYNEQKQVRVFDWELLEKKFRAVVEADERFAEAWFNLGVIAERQRKPDEARRCYQMALERKPSLKQAAENLAVMAQNEGKPADALAVYQEILRRNPDDGAARARIASLYREVGDVERAMRFAREALMREPQNLTAYKVMMRVYLDRNNLNMARLVALRATRIAQDPELFYAMGQIALKEGDEQGAVLQFRQALKERDDYLAARMALAEIAARHRDWANAGEQYRKIVQYDPKNVPARVNLGLSYKGLGEIDKAMAEYDAAIKADPGYAPPYFFMGVIFQRHKDEAHEKALEYYKKFVEVSGGAIPMDHPVVENMKETEQFIRQLAEAKAAEERARLEAQAAEERAKREEEEKKRLEEQKRKEEADQARAAEEAQKQADKERREKEAKELVDSALGGGAAPAQGGAKDPAPPKPEGAEKPVAPEKPADSQPADPPKMEKPGPAPEVVPASGSDAATSDEPQDVL